MPEPIKTSTVDLFGSALQAAAVSGKRPRLSSFCSSMVLLPNYATRHIQYCTRDSPRIALEDLEKDELTMTLGAARLKHYGPAGYYDPTTPWLRCFPESVRPAPRTGIDHVPHFDFSLLAKRRLPGYH